jgi:hypothetical protein
MSKSNNQARGGSNAASENESPPAAEASNAARIKELEAKWDGIRPDSANQAELEQDRKEYAALKAKQAKLEAL